MTAEKAPAMAGVEMRPLRVIADDRGAVLHMLRADSPGFSGFGEVYFSELRPGVTKGWKLHLKMTQRLAVPVGRIQFVLYDDRPDSPTHRKIVELQSGRPDCYGLLVIPPGIWYAFRNLAAGPSLLANCADLWHDPLESRVRPLNAPEIPYIW